MIEHKMIDEVSLKGLIRRKDISVAGNRRLRIFGELFCRSGKRMKRGHRVFFASTDEAIQKGYRPCGQCMRAEYDLWKRQER